MKRLSSRSYTKNNPLLLELKKKEILESQRDILNQKIKAAETQQNFIDLYRNVEVSQELYTMLLNKRLEYAIMQANTVGNIRVIDDAYIEKKVAPNGFRSLFLAFALSVFIAITVSIIRGLYFSRISNPAEIEDSELIIRFLGFSLMLKVAKITGKIHSVDRTKFIHINRWN